MIWATGTNGWGGVVAVMQTDCNFVLSSFGRPIWATNTNGRGSGCRMVMQSDSNLAIYTSTGGVVWALF